jgi:SPP1 family predicted phage head-tail adaptor
VGSLVPAEIAPLSGREFIAAAATQSKVTARITIRHRPGIAPSMRVVHRDTTYNVEAVLPDARSGIRHMTLLCSYGVNPG